VNGIVSVQNLLNLRRSQGLQLLLDICPPSILLFIATSTIQLSPTRLLKFPTQQGQHLALPLFA
jgi:hypothetical protein